MKIKFETVAAVIAVVFIAIYMGWMTIPGLNIGTGTTGGPSSTLQTVTKPIKFTVLDKYGGSAINGAANSLKVYTTDLAQVDSLDPDANGQATTTASWTSGTLLHVLFADSSSRQWYAVTVPKMTAADADSLTTTPVLIQTFTYTAPTISVRDSAGNAYANTGDYNYTLLGDTPVFTVTWFEGTDNKGFIESYDPIYQVSNRAILVVKFSGVEYDSISITGFEGKIERGSAVYCYHLIDPTTLTKWKVGDNYRYPGSGSYSFNLGLSGVSGSAANMDFYLYFYADWNYFVGMGNFGPNALNTISALQVDIVA